jgi:hypothetical protein
MIKSKRPWRRHAKIERVELNNSELKFETFTAERGLKKGAVKRGTHEDLASAEADLDAWFQEFWPKQERRRTPA